MFMLKTFKYGLLQGSESAGWFARMMINFRMMAGMVV